MSKTIGKIKALWRRLTDKEYRDAYVAGKVANDVAFQVYYLRERRGWTQGRLASEAGTQQPAISRLERSVGAVNVGTLLKVAAAFDVGLSIRFVPFSRLVAEGVNDRLDQPIPSFAGDFPPLAVDRTHNVTTGESNPLLYTSSEGTVFGWKSSLPLDGIARVRSEATVQERQNVH